MTCCNCHCSPCSCHTAETRVPAPQVQVLHMGTPDCCPIKGWYDTLAAATWTPPANGETALVPVCDATKFPVGTCVVLWDDAGNRRVLKVTGWMGDCKAISLLGYANEAAVGGTLSGKVHIAPLAICPVETEESGLVCDRDYMLTAEAFVMPTAVTSSGGSVQLVFDRPQTLQNAMLIYVVGAGYMTVTTPPDGPFVECGTSFYAFNSGTDGNAGAGTTIPAGASAYPDTPPARATAGTDASGLIFAHGSTGTHRIITAPGTDTDLTVTLTGVSSDDLIEIWGEMNTLSPAMRLSFNVTGTASPALFEGVPCDIYDGDINNTYCVNPRIHTHRKVVMKATSDGTVIVKWSWENLYAAGANRCSANIYERNLFAQVIGNDP